MSERAAPCAGCGGGVAGAILRARSGRDLAGLKRTWGRFEAIELATDALDESERVRWEARLLARYTACGCDTGAVAVLLALAGALVAGLASPNQPSWGGAGIALALCLAAALVGKVVGIAVARLRLARDVRRLGRLLDASGG